MGGVILCHRHCVIVSLSLCFHQGAGIRVFYESLYRQKPTSVMALLWCVEHGVFPEEEAPKRYQEYLRLKGKAPAAAPPPAKKRKAAPKKGKGKTVDTTEFDPELPIETAEQ